MIEINNINSFKTSCSYTGTFLDASSEEKLNPFKKELIEKAIKQYKDITECRPFCFQLHNEELLFWFNYNETTKTLSHSLEPALAATITF